MALWEIAVAATEAHDFADIVIVEELDYYDGHLTFTFLDRKGAMFMAHLCAIGVGVCRYLASETTAQTIVDLKRGAVSIRAALTLNPLWIIDVPRNGRVARAWRVTLADLPDDAIPHEGVTLNPEHEQPRGAAEAKAQ